MSLYLDKKTAIAAGYTTVKGEYTGVFGNDLNCWYYVRADLPPSSSKGYGYRTRGAAWRAAADQVAMDMELTS